MERPMSTTTAPATAATIGHELVGLCRQGRNGDAIERLYSRDIVSVEPMGSEEMPAESKGIDAVHKKHDWWTANMEVHKADVKGPFVGDDEFAVYFDYDTTFKPTGQRSSMKEMALYTVRDGQIVREEFFYRPNAG
jgi:ketosteroid isomerase-like protein